MKAVVKPSLWKIATEPFPLENVRIEGLISNLSADISIIHTFRTSKEVAKDVVLKFPLYDVGLIYGYEINVGDTHIVGKVLKKSEVDREYKNATGEDFQVFLDYNCPDIFVFRASALPAEALVSVTIKCVCDLLLDGERPYFIFPTNMLPRHYVHESVGDAEADSAKDASDDGEVKQDKTTSVITSNFLTQYNLILDLKLEMFGKIKGVESPAHNIRFTPNSDSPTRGTVIMANNAGEVSDADLVIFMNIEASAGQLFPRCILERLPGATYPDDDVVAMVLLKPEFTFPPVPESYEGHPDPREIVFIIDLSNNPPIRDITQACSAALKELSEKTQVYFNIVVGKDKIYRQFPKSTIANLKNIMKALAFCVKFPKEYDSLPASSKVLPLLEVMKNVYEQDVISEEIPRSIFLFTNGQISRSTHLLGLISENSERFAIFPLGFGNHCSQFLLSSMARETAGEFEIAYSITKDKKSIIDRNSAKEKALRQVRRIIQPFVEDLRMEWGELVADPTPGGRIIWSGDLLTVYNSFPSLPEEPVTVKLIANQSRGGESEFPVVVDPSTILNDQSMIHKQWAGYRIEELSVARDEANDSKKRELREQIEELGVKYSICSCFSSIFTTKKNVTLKNEGNTSTVSSNIILASACDFDQEAIELDSVKRYGFKEMMDMQHLVKDMPPGLPSWLVKGSTEEQPHDHKRGRRHGQHHNRRAKAGGGPPPPRTKKLELKTQWDNLKTTKALEEIFREANQLLNKLSRDNFGSIVKKIVNLREKGGKINAVVFLEGIVKLVFEKSVRAPHYAAVFADLCKILSQEYPKVTMADGFVLDFRRLLLDRCKHEFDRKDRTVLDEEAKKEDEGAKNEEKKEEEKEKVDEAKIALEKEELEFKQRERMFGNITFVGELYIKGIIKSSIIHHILRDMMRPADETEEEEEKEGEQKVPNIVDLELSAKLVTTIGQKLDGENDDKTDEYFSLISVLSKDKRIQTRIRYMLLDLMDLRKNGWKARNALASTGPMTIEEVHKVAEAKRIEKEQKMQQLHSKSGSSKRYDDKSWGSQQRKKGGGGGSRKDMRSPRTGTRFERSGKRGDISKSGHFGKSPRTGRDRGGRDRDFMSTSTGGSRRGMEKGGPRPWGTKSGSSSGTVNGSGSWESPKTGGRGGGNSKHSGGKYSGGGSSKNGGKKDGGVAANAFKLLMNDDDDGEDTDEEEVVEENDRGSNSSTPSRNDSKSPRPEGKKENGGKGGAWKSTSSPTTLGKGTSSTSSELSDEKVKKLVEMSLKEYLDAEELDTTLEDLRDLVKKSTTDKVGEEIVTMTLTLLDSKVREFKLAVGLFEELLKEKHNLISENSLINGLKNFFEQAEDIYMDFPKLFVQFGILSSTFLPVNSTTASSTSIHITVPQLYEILSTFSEDGQACAKAAAALIRYHHENIENGDINVKKEDVKEMANYLKVISLLPVYMRKSEDKVKHFLKKEGIEEYVEVETDGS